MTESVYIPSETCKFPREAAEIERMMQGFPRCGIKLEMRKQYPHPHTLSNLKRLARMPIGMK